MQTFLPFPNIKASAGVLDRPRLGKQRVEGLQILYNLLGKKVEPSLTHGPKIVPHDASGWDNHPIVRMWENNINALGLYTIAICDEWILRGHADTVKIKVRLLIPGINSKWNVAWPTWLGDDDFHMSHRSNLIRKDPKYYRDRLGWTDPDNLPYIWPIG